MNIDILNNSTLREYSKIKNKFYDLFKTIYVKH